MHRNSSKVDKTRGESRITYRENNYIKTINLNIYVYACIYVYICKRKIAHERIIALHF